MGTKYTAGPWSVGISEKEIRVRCEREHMTVCFMRRADIGIKQEHNDSAIADALLISAAPELLAACEAMQLALRSGPSQAKDYSHELSLARSAIGKATGERSGHGISTR